MNNLIKALPEAKMSSREIADLTDKQHRNVIPVCKDLVGKGVLKSSIPQKYTNKQNNQEYTEYLLNKRDSLVLVARLSPGFTGVVVDRWLELEKSANEFEIPQTLSGALRLASLQAEQIEEQEKQLAIAAPKVDFYNAVTGSDDCIDMAQAAKVLNIKGIGRNKLFDFLRENKILRANNQPYQRYCDSGYFRLIETNWTDALGDTHVRTKTVVLQKGLNYIRKLVKESC